MNDYATHLPILECISNNISCDSVFEFGMGNYSTKLFAERFKKVTSVEMQEKQWYDNMMAQNLPSHVSLHCALGERPAIDLLNSTKDRYSCILVDGHGSNRWECINESFDKTDIIVTHNTETIGYNWYLVNKPKHFTWIDIKLYNPWTSVITCNRDVIRLLVTTFPSYTIRD